MTVKSNATVVVDSANNINWSFITNLPTNLVTTVTITGGTFPVNQITLVGHTLTINHATS